MIRTLRALFSETIRPIAYLDGRIQGAVLVALIALLPLAFQKGFSEQILSIVLFVEIYMILALGLNLVVGFTGLLDLGYVIFMATGAVLTVFMCGLRRTATGYDWPIGVNEAEAGELVFGFDGSIFVIMLLAGLACAVLGVLRGIPTLRVRGDYFAIVTLGVAEIFFETSLWDETNPINFTRITGGAFGAKLAAADRPALFGEQLFWRTPHLYFLVLAVLICTFVVCHHVNRSRTGRALAAIRLDETAARACGVNVSRYKLIVFALSGFLGGVGGCMYALWAGTVAVKSLDVWQSIIILCCIVLGGMGSIRGVAVGTALLMSLGELLREDFGGVTVPPEARFLVYGFLLILVMRYRPQGVLPPDRRGKPLSEARKRQLGEGPAPLYALGATEPAADPEASS